MEEAGRTIVGGGGGVGGRVGADRVDDREGGRREGWSGEEGREGWRAWLFWKAGVIRMEAEEWVAGRLERVLPGAPGGRRTGAVAVATAPNCGWI